MTKRTIFWTVIVVLIILCFIRPIKSESYMTRKERKELRKTKKQQLKVQAVAATKLFTTINKSKCIEDENNKKLLKDIYRLFRRSYIRINILNERVSADAENMSAMLEQLRNNCNDDVSLEAIESIRTELNTMYENVKIDDRIELPVTIQPVKDTVTVQESVTPTPEDTVDATTQPAGGDDTSIVV